MLKHEQAEKRTLWSLCVDNYNSICALFAMQSRVQLLSLWIQYFFLSLFLARSPQRWVFIGEFIPLVVLLHVGPAQYTSERIGALSYQMLLIGLWRRWNHSKCAFQYQQSGNNISTAAVIHFVLSPSLIKCAKIETINSTLVRLNTNLLAKYVQTANHLTQNVGWISNFLQRRKKCLKHIFRIFC